MRCSVVIPNWNGRRFLERCLNALRKQTLTDHEVIVVDNGSSDDSVAFIEGGFREVRVIRLGQNCGFATAMNAGIRQAAADHVAFLNNDTAPDPRWLEELLACLQRHPAAAAATPKMLLLNDSKTIDDAGDSLTRGLLPYMRGHGETDAGQYDAEEQVFSASGGAAMWRAAALQELGGFDDAFFAYYEDVDLGFRARLAGYECWYAPRALVLHERGGSNGGEIDRALFYHVRNRWWMILRNVPASLLLRRLPLVLASDATWWFRARSNRSFLPLLRAYADVVGGLGRVLSERRRIQAARRLQVRELERLVADKPQ